MPDLTSMLRSNWERGRLRTATVTAVSTTGRVDLSWQGSFVPSVPYLGWYSPTAGDVVQVMVENGALLCLGTLSAGGAGGLGPNLHPNPSFELGAAGAAPSAWLASQSYIKKVDTVAHSGGSSALYDLTGVASGATPSLSSTNAIAVDPGITYRCGGWFKGSAADTAITATAILATGPNPADTFSFVTGTFTTAATDTIRSAWKEVAGTVTIPAGQYFARLSLGLTTAGGRVVNSVWLDDATLQRQT